MTKEHCLDCYYRGINTCQMYNKNYEEVEKCTEYLMDAYLYNNENLRKKLEEERRNIK